MKLIWRGHSCFILEHEGRRIVFDPFKPGSVPGLKDVHETADMVICSHEHSDHGYAQAVTVPADADPSVFKITQLDIPHDDAEGTLRGMNKITIVEAGGFKIAHFGDTGCELTADQKAALAGLDAAMVPIGGFYTIDAAQAAAMVKELAPHIVIPMHYRSDRFGFDVIGTLDQFTDCFDPAQVTILDTDTVEIEKGDGLKVFVPAYL